MKESCVEDFSVESTVYLTENKEKILFFEGFVTNFRIFPRTFQVSLKVNHPKGAGSQSYDSGKQYVVIEDSVKANRLTKEVDPTRQLDKNTGKVRNLGDPTVVYTTDIDETRSNESRKSKKVDRRVLLKSLSE